MSIRETAALQLVNGLTAQLQEERERRETAERVAALTTEENEHLISRLQAETNENHRISQCFGRAVEELGSMQQQRIGDQNTIHSQERALTVQTQRADTAENRNSLFQERERCNNRKAALTSELASLMCEENKKAAGRSTLVGTTNGFAVGWFFGPVVGVATSALGLLYGYATHGENKNYSFQKSKIENELREISNRLNEIEQELSL